MRTFVAVAEEEGFARAARKLGQSPPAVTRVIAALEERLGIMLLNRTTRHVRATEAGARYLEEARRILEEIDTADEVARGVNADPQGQIAVTAPILFGRLYVMPGILEYLRLNPKTSVSATFLDRTVNLLEEGFDVGIRLGRLPDSSLRALRVGEVNSVICASPDYVEEHGKPETHEDINKHTIVAVSSGSSEVTWRFETEEGVKNIHLKPRLTVTTNSSALAGAEAGFGLTKLLSYQSAKSIASGKLVQVLSEFEQPAIPIHIIHREGRIQSTKVRSFIDLMAERLRAESFS